MSTSNKRYIVGSDGCIEGDDGCKIREQDFDNLVDAARYAKRELFDRKYAGDWPSLLDTKTMEQYVVDWGTDEADGEYVEFRQSLFAVQNGNPDSAVRKILRVGELGLNAAYAIKDQPALENFLAEEGKN